MAPSSIGGGGRIPSPVATPDTLSPSTSTESLEEARQKPGYTPSTDSLEVSNRSSTESLSSDSVSTTGPAIQQPDGANSTANTQGNKGPPPPIDADVLIQRFTALKAKVLGGPTKAGPSDAEVDNRYNLDTPVRQKGGTNQCWWLSFLETLRDQEVLGDAFKTGNLVDKEPPDQKKGKSVYGPKWQRTVMAHLKSQTGVDAWYKPEDTIPVRDRPAQLSRLLKILGVENVELKEPMVLTPINIDDKFKELKVGQSVQVDKANHAMSGIVETEEYVSKGKTKTRKIITVYNQASGNEFTCRLRGKGMTRNLSSAGGTEINFIIPIEIKPPDPQVK